MNDFDSLYKELVEHIAQLENKFINEYVPADPALLPSVYDLDVRAYCILSHAAFEQFFEQVALKVMIQSIDNWMEPERKINGSLLALAAFSDKRLKYDEMTSDIPFDNLKNTFEAAKKSLSQLIIKKNHGISADDLATILLPVGLHIHTDINLRNSLNQLVRTKGRIRTQRNAQQRFSSRRCSKICF